MDRLLMMRLYVQGCSAEALINDISVGRVGPGGGGLSLPVHEYLLDGANEVGLVINPAPAGSKPAPALPRLAEGVVGARLRLLLPRIGKVGSELEARTVAEVVWSVPDGDVYSTPQTLMRSVFLPIKFPRWRWLDAPVVDDVDANKPLIASFLQAIAVDLLRGDAETFLTASRLRMEELASAYQLPVGDVATKLRSRLQLLHATKALRIVVPHEADLLLRRCAGGRLIECMTGAGGPALATLPGADGTSSSWPVRVAVVNGHCHILR